MYEVNKLFLRKSVEQTTVHFTNRIPSHVRNLIFVTCRNKTFHFRIEDVQAVCIALFGVPAHELHA